MNLKSNFKIYKIKIDQLKGETDNVHMIIENVNTFLLVIELSTQNIRKHIENLNNPIN